MTSHPKVLITGITGFIGVELKKVIQSSSYQLFGLIRENKKISHSHDSQADRITYLTLDEIEKDCYQFDIIINLAGENIAGARWSNKRKETLRSSRVTLTERLYRALDKKPKHLISMSAVGIYGVDTSKSYSEDDSGEDGFAYQLCKDWEQAAWQFTHNDTRVCIVRLGVVLGRGGALKKMEPTFKIGLGGNIGSGQQWFPWIHIDDAINLILFLINNEDLQGIFNAVSPNVITQDELATSLANVMRKPCFLTTPTWLLTLLFGEMASLLTQGVQVLPTKTLKSGFTFKYKNINNALKEIYKTQV